MRAILFPMLLLLLPFQVMALDDAAFQQCKKMVEAMNAGKITGNIEGKMEGSNCYFRDIDNNTTLVSGNVAAISTMSQEMKEEIINKAACDGKSIGYYCSFVAEGKEMAGVCGTALAEGLFCLPSLPRDSLIMRACENKRMHDPCQYVMENNITIVGTCMQFKSGTLLIQQATMGCVLLSN